MRKWPKSKALTFVEFRTDSILCTSDNGKDDLT